MAAATLSQAPEPALAYQTVSPDAVGTTSVALNIQGLVVHVAPGAASVATSSTEQKRRPARTNQSSAKRNSDKPTRSTTTVRRPNSAQKANTAPKPSKARKPAAARKPDRVRTRHRTLSANSSQGRRIVRLASRHLGAKFRLGATGPRYFDCSGLIYRVYQQAGLLSKVGGNRTAAGYYNWFKSHGQASKRNPRPGDLVIWTDHGRISHSGIYAGGGRVISALINPWGVKKTHVHTIHARFRAYLHVRW